MSYYDDPCECISSHEAMMQRLLDILRQTQDECSDGDCTTEMNASSTNTFTIGFITLLLSAFAMLMFYTRPNSLRPSSKIADDKKSGAQNNNNFGDRHQPPPSVG
uniref:Small integral membrane protein 14 n=1 Tax=Panagrolaimus sp. ES5 TaxID=591445 RepID=A0AC34F5R5_9BILA